MSSHIERILQLSGVGLIILGFFLAFIIGYFVPGFPSWCALGGFVLLLLGGILLAFNKTTTKKRDGVKQKLLDNQYLTIGVFLFIGMTMILLSCIGVYRGDFNLVWEEPLLYSAIGICLVLAGIYLYWKEKQ